MNSMLRRWLTFVDVTAYVIAIAVASAPRSYRATRCMRRHCHLVAVALWVLLGCSRLDLMAPIPRNADPAERNAVALLRPFVENMAWDASGNVWCMDVHGIDTTNEVLAAICQLTELEILNIAGSTITDGQLGELRCLPRLSSLGLQYTGITDVGLAELVHMEPLVCIDLMHTSVSDRGLELLSHKANLKYLFVTGTPTTDDGIARMRQALPGCRIQK